MDDPLLRELANTKTDTGPLPSSVVADGFLQARRLLAAYPVPYRSGSWVLLIAPHLSARWIELRPPVCTVGRVETNTLVLHDPEVSRFHCRLSFDGSFWHVEDKGSRNGVHLRGERLRDRCLRSGDLLRMGSVHLLFYQGEGDQASGTI